MIGLCPIDIILELRAIADSLGITCEQLACDIAQANYCASQKSNASYVQSQFIDYGRVDADHGVCDVGFGER